MVQNEYEVISHNNTHFHLFLVNLVYRTPHIHKDYEICLILEGALTLITPESVMSLEKNDLFIINPFQSHEIKAESPVPILSLQVSPSFFVSYYPQMEHMEFDVIALEHRKIASDCRRLREYLLSMTNAYYQKEEYHALKCAAIINLLFHALLSSQKHHVIPEKEWQASVTRRRRMRKILQYIDNHYTEKLLLSDIAKQENLDLYYLSHFFKECFGISFQDYLTRTRCEQARQLLILTDYSLLDISISCGFSDPKYFTSGFRKQYGCTPKEYRKNFSCSVSEQKQASMLTAQKFISEEEGLALLKRYL